MTDRWLSELAEKLRPHLADIAEHYWGKPAARGRGTWRWEDDHKLRVNLSGKRALQWFDYSTGEGGDALDLLTHALGDRERAIAEARRWLGDDRERPRSAPSRPAVPPPTDAPPIHETLADPWRRFWASCEPITPECVAGQYLATRGCVLPPDGSDLKWHPNAAHPSGYRGPALVALVTDVRDPGRWLSLHRTWILPCGEKASVSPTRLLLKGHAKAGGCIRLWPDDAVSVGLGLAEGIETALSLARVYTPVWAALDAGNLRDFPTLPGIEALTLAEDADPAGRGACATLAKRYRDAGRDAIIVGGHAGGN